MTTSNLDFSDLFKARIPLVWCVTTEDGRIETELCQWIYARNGISYSWSLTSFEGGPGWAPSISFLDDQEMPEAKKTKLQTPPWPQNPAIHLAVRSVIDWANKEDNKVNNKEILTYAIFRQPHMMFNDPQFIQSLKDASRELRGTHTSVVCLSCSNKIPEEIRADVTLIEPPLPSEEQLAFVIKDAVEGTPSDKAEVDNHSLTQACKGLTLVQASNALYLSYIKLKKLDADFISNYKAKSLSSIPGLTYEPQRGSLSNVGGLENLKGWLKKRKILFTPEAKAQGIEEPKGILLVGVPGCGKSLIGRSVAAEYDCPLLTLDLNAVKGGIVGQTEGQIRSALRVAEAIGRSVMRIDEIEKALSVNSTHQLDGGTSSDILGTMLSWLQDRPGGTFVVVTANDISALPPELLRKGRFDEIFFVDVPNPLERVDILVTHLKQRNRELPIDDLTSLAYELDGYVGSELEAGVKEGIVNAFSENRSLTVEDLRVVFSEMVPLSKMMEERITALREWAKSRARNASLPYIPTKKVTKSSRLILDETDDFEVNKK